MEQEKNTATTVADESTPFLERPNESKFVAFCRKHKKIVIPVAVMIALLPLLGLIALKNHGARAEWTSPVVYPSPEGYGAGDWAQAYEKARTMVAKMTLEEMNNLTYGHTTDTGCVGVSGAVPRLGFPGFCLQDAGNGVRGTDGVNAYASGISVGATWNASLAYERGMYMGAEFKKKGVNVALGPVVGPLGRIATGGREWEGFAADPYLDGILGAQTVKGLQENVISCVKHFVAYEQETNRNPSTSGNGIVQSTSANLDDRTLHELYLWPFQDIVHAGVGAVMCSYNRINNTYACENSKTISLLKGELNFQGFLVSDWVDQYSNLPSAYAGLDMAMPFSPFWDNDQLAKNVQGGEFNRSRLEDMATRIVATWYQFGQDDPSYPALGSGMPQALTKDHSFVNARDPESKTSLMEQAIQGHVLLKNINNALPLQKPKVLSIFGYDAPATTTFDPSTATWVQNWEGIDLSVSQIQQLSTDQPLSNAPGTYQGALTVGGGSGSNVNSFMISPFDALQLRAMQDDTVIFYDFTSLAPGVVAASDACLVFINEFAAESFDRPGLADFNSDVLVKSVASTCSNTIVVVHNAGIRLVDAWIDNPNVTAVIFAHLPGQETGRSIVSLLYGDASFSGRLPYTVAKQAIDYGTLLFPCQAFGSDSPQCDFDEGTNIDYRHFLSNNIEPRFPFGFGLTYSSFGYSNLDVQLNATTADDVVAPVFANGTTDGNLNNTNVIVGGVANLFESVGTVSAQITNTGGVTAAEVAQLYIQLPANNATRVLRGFEKLSIAPGQSATATFNLRRKDLSYWDVTAQAWKIPSGEIQIFVGKDVLDKDGLTTTYTPA